MTKIGFTLQQLVHELVTRFPVAAVFRELEKQVPALRGALSGPVRDAEPAAAAAPPRLLSLAEVMDRVHFSKSTIYKLMAADEFPKPVMIGTTARWVESEVDGWILAQVDRRDAPPQAA